MGILSVVIATVVAVLVIFFPMIKALKSYLSGKEVQQDEK